MPEVIGYGQAGMDLCLTFDSAPVANEAAFANEMSWQYGGTVTTGLCATKILSGCSCGMVSTYRGPVGNLVIRDLERHGIDCSQMIEADRGSSRLTVVLAYDNARTPCGLPHSLPNLQEKDIDPAYMEGAKYIFTHKSEPGHIQAAKYAKERGIKVLLDGDVYGPNMPELLKYVDYAIFGEKCYRDMFGDSNDYQENLVKIREMCPEGALVIVTLGEKGLVGLDDDGYFEQGIFKVKTVDTAGCGDVFHGAFIAGLLRGMDNRTCARYAAGCSAIKATRIGCRAGIPTHEVLMRFLETGEIDYTEIDKRVAYYAQMPVFK